MANGARRGKSCRVLFLSQAASFFIPRATISPPVQVWSLPMHLLELCGKLIPSACWFETKCKFRKGFQRVNFPCYAPWRTGGLGIITSLRSAWGEQFLQGVGWQGTKSQFMTLFCSYKITVSPIWFLCTQWESIGDNVREHFAFKRFLYSKRFTNVISLNQVPLEVH